MRKYLHLITEHDDPDMVGLVKLTDSPIAHAKKNEERVIHTLDVEALDAGEMDLSEYQCVGLGYADFEDEDDYRERAPDVLRQKFAEIDGAYLEKVGLDVDGVAA